MNHKRWHILSPVPRGHPLDKCGLSPLMTQVSFNRGLADASQVEPFLAVDKRLSPDPFLLPDMEQAVTRIYRAVLSGDALLSFQKRAHLRIVPVASSKFRRAIPG